MRSAAEGSPLALVQAIFLEQFGMEAEQVVPEARLVEDLDLDSIDAVDMIVEIQSMSGVLIPEESLQDLRTVGEVVELVSGLLKEGKLYPAGG